MEQVGDEIKKEWQKLRAPESLVERTKEAAKQEEAKVAGRRKKMVRYVAGGSVLAAAAVLFILITSLDMGRQAKERQVPPMSAGTWLKLGTAAEDKEIYLEEEVSMERVNILPMAFVQAQREEIICGVTVLFVRSDAGVWMAAYEEQDTFVVITARVDEEQEMAAIMERILEAQQ